MAVQAQYPSNVLPFHRTDPEMKTATGTAFAADAQAARQLQLQGHSGFLDPHHALFFPGVVAASAASNPNHNDISTNNYNSIGNNNSSTHPRKRSRDAVEGIGGGGSGGGGIMLSPTVFPPSCDRASSAAMMSRGILVPTQPMLPQVSMAPSLLLGGAGLSQLHAQQRQNDEVPISMVSTGLRLSLEDKQQTQHQQQSSVVPPIPDELAAVAKQQREEIERYILMQSEHLRRSITETRRRQFRSLVSAAEEYASRKLREKQSELDRASRTRSDLEARAARLASEAAAWQAKARAGEAAVAALRAQLDRAAADQQAQATTAPLDADRRGSSDAASACVDPRREEMERLQAAAPATASTSSRPPLPRSPGTCRQCGSGTASVVLLPCRHLCLCSSCSQDAATLPAACPVCFCARSVAVEVFFA